MFFVITKCEIFFKNTNFEAINVKYSSPILLYSVDNNFILSNDVFNKSKNKYMHYVIIDVFKNILKAALLGV